MDMAKNTTIVAFLLTNGEWARWEGKSIAINRATMDNVMGHKLVACPIVIQDGETGEYIRGQVVIHNPETFSVSVDESKIDMNRWGPHVLEVERMLEQCVICIEPTHPRNQK